MIRKLLLLALAFAALLAAPSSEAALFRTGAAVVPPAGYIGPGDITAFTAYWSLRCFSNAKATGTTNVARIRRLIDSATLNIKCLTDGTFDKASALAFTTRGTFTGATISGTTLSFSGLTGTVTSGDQLVCDTCNFSPAGVLVEISGTCTASPCTITSSQTVASPVTMVASTPTQINLVYDQVGTNNLTKSIGGANYFPVLMYNCTPNKMPCWQMITSNAAFISANLVTLVTGNASEFIVGNRATYAHGVGDWLAPNGSYGLGITTEAAANRWTISNDAILFSNAAGTDGAWHAAAGMSNGAATVLAIDGIEVTGTVGASFARVNYAVIEGPPGGGQTMDQTDAAFMDNVIWTHGSAGSVACQLQRNAGTFYGFSVGGVC